MLGRIEKYHHGRYASLNRSWLMRLSPDGTFKHPVICPNCESTELQFLGACGECLYCELGFVPDLIAETT